MRRRSAFAAVAALLTAGVLTACSLLTSLDGLAGGPTDADAGRDTGATPVEGGGGDGGDAGSRGDGGNAGDSAPSASTLYANAVLSDKPLGYWRLEETAGTIAKDETGHNDGTFINLPLLAQPGVAGSNAAKLPKDTDARMVVTTGNFAFTGNAPYTIELWAKPGEFKDYQWLGGTEIDANGRHGWSLLADAAGKLRYEAWNPDADGGDVQTRGVFVAVTSLVPGAFAHIVVAYTGSTAFGYVNGVQTTMFDTLGTLPAAGPLLWGCRGDIMHCLDDWVIDELAIYDFALDGARVTAHYDLGK
jgi:hypothetical protein